MASLKSKSAITISLVTSLSYFFSTIEYTCCMQAKLTPNNLKRHRRITGYSQTEVAAILGISYTATISKWEKGILYPNVQQLFTLAILYNTTPQALYFHAWQEQQDAIAMMKAREIFERKQAIRTEELFYL